MRESTPIPFKNPEKTASLKEESALENSLQTQGFAKFSFFKKRGLTEFVLGIYS